MVARASPKQFNITNITNMHFIRPNNGIFR
ncbi:MAG: hypothetical protein ACI94D_000882 [Neolewinella sp.]|jgi:hypothetical protein